MAECFVCVGNCAVFRGGLEERQAMEIHLACGGFELLYMALKGWPVAGKVSGQCHYVVCNVRKRHTSHWRDVGPGNEVAAWTLTDLPDFSRVFLF